MQRFITLLALLALAACTTSQPALPPPPPDPATQMGALEKRIMALVEDERLKIDPKAKALVLDPELASVARARAADMAAKNYLAHEAPDGETSATLLMKVDTQWQGLLGENLAAQHYVKQSGVSVEAFAQRFLETWVNSQPHKDNLAFVDYDRTGVGAAVNGDTVYVAQLFSSNLGLGTHNPKAPAAKVTRFDSPGAAKAAPVKQPGALQLRGAEGIGGNSGQQ